MKRLILLPGGLVAIALLALWLLPRDDEPANTPGIEELAAEVAQEGGDSLHAEVVSRQDLPPEGTRSLFDHVIRENGALPFPFERVIEMLAAYDAQGRSPRTLLIPDGRSLLKGQASFDAPRVVVAADARIPQGAALPPVLRGRLFLGFVEDADEIEVISYNEAAGRFEFQLVENYCAGCVPRIVYAKRAVCTTCHAGAGPIFPVRPWEETNVQPAIHRRLSERLQSDSYHGAPVVRRLDDGQAFDDLTDSGNFVPVTQKIWLDGCGLEGNPCRRQMLKLALRYLVNPAALDQDSAAVDELVAMQRESWPAAGIAVDNGNLNNRNPLEQGLYDEGFGAQLRNLLFPGQEQLRSGDKLKDFDSLPPLPAEFDPLTPRPPLKRIQASDLDGVFGIAQLLDAGDISRLERAASYQWERLAAAVDALPQAYFEPRPFQRVPLVRALLVELGETEPPYCCLDTAKMSDPIAQGEPPLELAADSVLQPFREYCFACHRGNPSARLNFMSGAEEEAVLAQIRDLDNLRDVLDYERYLGTRKAGQLMPPADSWQREALEEAMARGEDPLAAMREQAPSLFDF